MRGSDTASARRYARALVEVAAAKGEADAVRSELRRAVALLAREKELAASLAHPGLPAEKRKALVAAVFKDGTELTRRLLTLLVERGRLSLLPRIEQVYTALYNAQRGVVAAAAVSAVALEESQRQALERAIAATTGRGVELATAVEPAVLGGVVLKMDGRVYDGTVRAQLEALRARLSGASHS
jgi:F-type H+-transporting ATPase subunit delta